MHMLEFIDASRLISNEMYRRSAASRSRTATLPAWAQHASPRAGNRAARPTGRPPPSRRRARCSACCRRSRATPSACVA
eukprot:5264048-Prymnesium_polylepis.1